MFYVFRAIMALFGTAFFSVGSSIIGDIFMPEERGSALGILLIGSQTGLAVAAVIGGAMIQHATWRDIFILQGAIGALVSILSIVFLKETGTDILILQYQKDTGKKFKFFKFNPFKSLYALKYGIVVMVSLMCSTLMYNMFALLTPITYTIKDHLHIESSLLTSLFYLAPGIGFLSGSIFGGKWSDYNVKKYKKLRGKRIPEDRLRAILLFYGIGIPVSMLIYGWSLKKNFGGIPLPVIMMFSNGLSQCICFTSLNAYSVDAVPQIASDLISNGYFIRFLMAAVANGTILSQMNGIGVGWTCTITATIQFIGLGLLVALIIFGEKLRNRTIAHLSR